MKKTFATILITGSAIALSACITGNGNVDIEPPYAMERTARHVSPAPAVAPVVNEAKTTPVRTTPAERVFQRAQTK